MSDQDAREFNWKNCKAGFNAPDATERMVSRKLKELNKDLLQYHMDLICFGNAHLPVRLLFKKKARKKKK